MPIEEQSLMRDTSSRHRAQTGGAEEDPNLDLGANWCRKNAFFGRSQRNMRHI